MKISTKIEYGIVALIDISINMRENEVVTVSSISERQGISKNYLEQVLTPLRQAGIIVGTKGAQGGYNLTSKPESLKLSTILAALDSSLLTISADSAGCDENIKHAIDICLWSRMDSAVKAIAESVTLADLVEEYKKTNNTGVMFYI